MDLCTKKCIVIDIRVVAVFAGIVVVYVAITIVVFAANIVAVFAAVTVVGTGAPLLMLPSQLLLVLSITDITIVVGVAIDCWHCHRCC